MRAFRPAFLALSFLVLLPLAVFTGEPGREEQARAYAELIAQGLRRAAPSVASVLVSRSDEYHSAPFWGEPAPEDNLGHLGRFDAAAALARVPEKTPRRSRIAANIRAHDLSDPRSVPESYGSGFAVGPDLVLTNAHVVRNATKVYVRLPGKDRGSWADVHASDPRSDLAVLRLLDKIPDLKPLKLGKSEKVEIGQTVLALVNPWAPGFRDAEPVLSSGVVSRQREKAPGKLSELEPYRTLHHHGTLLHVDARLMPGCSGGVLLDLGGEAVGLTTALPAIPGTAESHGALAVPFDATTRRIIEVLSRGEEVEYGFLGVVPEVNRFGPGVEIRQVSPGSPAALAGLVSGDVIVSINGQPVKDQDDLFLSIGMNLAGTPTRLVVERGLARTKSTVTAILAKYYVPGPVIASSRPPARGGLRVDYTSLLSQRAPILMLGRGPPAGVIIREVISNSPADKARLQPDKIITAVNGRPVASPADYYREMEKAEGRANLTVLDSEGRPERVSLELR